MSLYPYYRHTNEGINRIMEYFSHHQDFHFGTSLICICEWYIVSRNKVLHKKNQRQAYFKMFFTVTVITQGKLPTHIYKTEYSSEQQSIQAFSLNFQHSGYLKFLTVEYVRSDRTALVKFYSIYLIKAAGKH